jgi:hypothetical protein
MHMSRIMISSKYKECVRSFVRKSIIVQYRKGFLVIVSGNTCYFSWFSQTVEIGRLKRMPITLCLLCGADDVRKTQSRYSSA